MSLRLWFTSFDWRRFEELLAPPAAEIAQGLATHVSCDRESAVADGGEPVFRQLPHEKDLLRSFLASVFSSADWYGTLPQEMWSEIDRLTWKIFDVRGFFAAALDLKPRTKLNGVLIETHDVACPSPPRHLRTEVYRMGYRRFRHESAPVYPDETYHDPGHSIHSPEQVGRILDEISAFDYADYPAEDVCKNFEEEFLAPLRACSAEGAELFARWFFSDCRRPRPHLPLV